MRGHTSIATTVILSMDSANSPWHTPGMPSKHTPTPTTSMQSMHSRPKRPQLRVGMGRCKAQSAQRGCICLPSHNLNSLSNLRIKVNNFMQAFFHTVLLFFSTNLLKNCLVISCKVPFQVKLTPAIAYIVSHCSGASLMQAAQEPLCPNLINTLKGEPFIVLAKLLLFI